MKTQERNLATYLISLGCKLISSEMNRSGNMEFEFPDDDQTLEYEQQFYHSGSLVHIHDYIAAERRIKSILHRSRKGRETEYHVT